MVVYSDGSRFRIFVALVAVLLLALCMNVSWATPDSDSASPKCNLQFVVQTQRWKVDKPFTTQLITAEPNSNSLPPCQDKWTFVWKSDCMEVAPSNSSTCLLYKHRYGVLHGESGRKETLLSKVGFRFTEDTEEAPLIYIQRLPDGPPYLVRLEILMGTDVVDWFQLRRDKPKDSSIFMEISFQSDFWGFIVISKSGNPPIEFFPFWENHKIGYTDALSTHRQEVSLSSDVVVVGQIPLVDERRDKTAELEISSLNRQQLNVLHWIGVKAYYVSSICNKDQKQGPEGQANGELTKLPLCDNVTPYYSDESPDNEQPNICGKGIKKVRCNPNDHIIISLSPAHQTWPFTKFFACSAIEYSQSTETTAGIIKHNNSPSTLRNLRFNHNCTESSRYKEDVSQQFGFVLPDPCTSLRLEFNDIQKTQITVDLCSEPIEGNIRVIKLYAPFSFSTVKIFSAHGISMLHDFHPHKLCKSRECGETTAKIPLGNGINAYVTSIELNKYDLFALGSVQRINVASTFDPQKGAELIPRIPNQPADNTQDNISNNSNNSQEDEKRIPKLPGKTDKPTDASNRLDPQQQTPIPKSSAELPDVPDLRSTLDPQGCSEHGKALKVLTTGYEMNKHQCDDSDSEHCFSMFLELYIPRIVRCKDAETQAVKTED